MRILWSRLLRLSIIFVEKQVNEKDNGVEELEYDGGSKSVRKSLVSMRLMQRSLVNRRFVEKEADIGKFPKMKLMKKRSKKKILTSSNKLTIMISMFYSSKIIQRSCCLSSQCCGEGTLFQTSKMKYFNCLVC